jgi:hypothetical protein
MKKQLEAMRRAAESSEPSLTAGQPKQMAPPAYPHYVFLAESTPDLNSYRDQIRRHLEQEEIGVLPDAFYDRAPAAFETAMKADLDRSLLFVQLLGQYTTPKTSDLPMGYEGLQLELARRADKPLLRWRDPDIDLGTVQAPEFLEEHDVIAMPFEEFKGELVNRIRRLDLFRDREEIISGEPFTLIRACPDDLDVANRITEIFMEYQVGFDIVDNDDFANLAADGEYQAHALLTRLRLRPSRHVLVALHTKFDSFVKISGIQGFLVIYGQCGREWTKLQLRNIRKIGIRQKRNPPVCAVYIDF